MDKTKLGVNDPCPCGSKKKYKKCCLGKYDKWGSIKPPENVRLAADQFRNPKFSKTNSEPIVDHGMLTGRPFIDTEFKGKRARAVGSRVYMRPYDESFHSFVLNRLWETLSSLWGADWQAKQVILPVESRHPFSRWFLSAYNLISKGLSPAEAKGYSKVKMSGDVKALLSFAYDLYTLEHHGVPIDDALWNRIAILDQFQGARYEIAIAALACRVGFKITWCKGKDKHGEFIGEHIASGEKIVFEAKSHTRDGVLGKGGVFDPKKTNLKIMQHINRAIEQTAGHGLPVLIFDDLNLPIKDNGTDQGINFKKVNSILDKNKFYDAYTKTHYGGLIVTNFSWHFHDDLPESHQGNDVMSYFHVDGKFSINPGIVGLLNQAAKEYGSVPAKLDEMNQSK